MPGSEFCFLVNVLHFLVMVSNRFNYFTSVATPYTYLLKLKLDIHQTAFGVRFFSAVDWRCIVFFAISWIINMPYWGVGVGGGPFLTGMLMYTAILLNMGIDFLKLFFLCSAIAHPPNFSDPGSPFTILNKLPSDSLMSNLYSRLGYSTWEFWALQLITVFGAVY